jgi:ABC-type transporter Mla MlaB component
VYGLGAQDLDEQLAVYDEGVTAAGTEGCAGLRVAADVTRLIGDPDRRAARLRWEHLSDRYAAAHPFAAMCLDDARVDTDADALSCLHPLRRDTPRPPSFTLFAGGPAVRLVGEVDAMAARTLAEVLEAARHDGDESLDLSGLTFADGRAATVHHDTVAQRAVAGSPLRLTGAARQVRRVSELCALDTELLAP